MAKVAADAVHVEGLKEFLAKIKALEVATPTKVVRTALNSAAALVVADAQRRAPSRSGALKASIRASSTPTFARVSEGSAAVPYAGFIDYGNKVRSGRGVGRGDSQARPFIRTGRVLYPAFRAQRESVITQLNTTLRDAIKSVGLGVDE
jgi:HK97 gp10 family phage protein